MKLLNLNIFEKFISVVEDETGFPVIICDENGYIIHATQKNQIGTFHSGFETIMKGSLDEYAVTAKEALKSPLINEGYNCAIYQNNKKIAAFGILGKVDVVKPIAKISKRMIAEWFKEFVYQHKMEHSEEKFKHIFNNLQDVYFETTLDGIIKMTSPSASKFSEYSIEELIGHGVDKLYNDPNDRQILLNKINENGSIRGMELLFKKKSGIKYNVSINADLCFDKHGKPTGLRGTIRDITKRKTTEKKLRENEEKFRLIFENSPLGILHFNKKGIITTCNGMLAKIIGSPREKIVGIDMFSLPDKRLSRTLNVVLKGETTLFEGQYTAVTSHKATSIRSIFGPLFSKTGEIEGALCIVEDISNRLKLENESRKLNHLNNEIIQSLPGLFYIFGKKEGKFLIRNKNWNAVTGYSDEELDNIIIHNFFSNGKDQKKCIQKVKEVFKLGMASMENNLLTKNRKKIPYFFTGTRMKIEGNEYLAGLGIDITDRRKAESKLIQINETLDIKVKKRTKALKKLNDHLIYSEEKERGKLAADIHDTAVQSIAMSLSKIKMVKKDCPEKIENNLSDIQNYLDQAVRELRSLIYQLCPPILKDFELGIALGFLIEENNKKYSSELVYFNNSNGTISLPETDKVTIYRAISELIMNIYKHSGTKKAEIELSNSKNKLFVRVQDWGRGFKLNHYVKTQFGGFGLYSLSERILNMNGSFKVNSDIDKGTTIKITVPME